MEGAAGSACLPSALYKNLWKERQEVHSSYAYPQPSVNV